MDDHVLPYFAYGSNLCPSQMVDRCPGAIALGRAILRDHRLTFPRFSTRWNCGSAGIESVEGEFVEGAIYRVDETHMANLDICEGVPQNHRRHEVTVIVKGAYTPAVAYWAISEGNETFQPSEEYLTRMLDGAKAHQLSESWIQRVRSWRQTC